MNKEEYELEEREKRKRRFRQKLIDLSWAYQIIGVILGLYLSYWIGWNVILKWLIKLL